MARLVAGILLFIFCCMSNVLAQKALPDSVQTVLESKKDVSEKFKSLDGYINKILYRNPQKARRWMDSSRRLAYRSGKAQLINSHAITRGNYYYFTRNLDSALYYYRQNLVYAKEEGIQSNKQSAYLHLGMTFDVMGNTDSAIYYGTKSLTLANKMGDSATLAKIHSDLAGFYITQDNYYEALNHLQKAENYEAPGNHFNMAILNIRKGVAYAETENAEKARSAYMTALAHNAKQNRHNLEPAIYNNLGRVYEMTLHELDSALYYYGKALRISKEAGQIHNVTMFHVNIGNIYLTRKEYAKARSYYNRVYKSSVIESMPKTHTAALVNLGLSNFELGNLDTARYYATKGLEMAQRNDYLKFERNAHKVMASIDSARGDYISALEHKDSVIAKNEKLRNKRLNDKIAELNVEHKVEQQEQENQYLQEKAALDQRFIEIQRLFIIALVAALFFIIYFIIRLQRKKRKLQAMNELLNKKNEELADNYKQLSSLNATKDKFFSIIAHDLKGPIGTQSEMLNELLAEYQSFDKDELYEYLKGLHKNGESSYALLLNLLDWSRTQQGRIENNPEFMDVEKSVQDVFDLLSARAKRKRLKLVNKLEGPQLSAYVDKALVSRVLYNLLSNAIKFTSEGRQITVAGRKEKNFIKVWIEDQGIGIPQENLNRLFTIDNTFKRKGTSNESGTGLGLMLCKEFVTLMGGDISADSKEGEGSTFTVKIPTKPVKEGERKTKEEKVV